MKQKAKHQKSHKWRKGKDAKCCIECGKQFKTGDMVYSDCAVNVHKVCVGDYIISQIQSYGRLT